MAAAALDFVGRKIETVQTKKNIGGQERRPLISVDKGMIADNAGGVGRRERAQIGLTVRVQVSWPRQAKSNNPTSRIPKAPPCSAHCAS